MEVPVLPEGCDVEVWHSPSCVTYTEQQNREERCYSRRCLDMWGLFKKRWSNSSSPKIRSLPYQSPDSLRNDTKSNLGILPSFRHDRFHLPFTAEQQKHFSLHMQDAPNSPSPNQNAPNTKLALAHDTLHVGKIMFLRENPGIILGLADHRLHVKANFDSCAWDRTTSSS